MLTFYKYQGAGNDFIMIDNRSLSFPKENTALIEHLCHRRFGIGADGLILLETDATYDFRMVYYNADGKESTMCGNGGRCLVAFAKQLQIIESSCTFVAIDGSHNASINHKGDVSLQMVDVDHIETNSKYTFLNTGSPHHVQIVRNLAHFNVYREGKKIRDSEMYAPSGTNVNFVEQEGPNHFYIRTYERGVENETLACGTGATAAAIAMHHLKKTKDTTINMTTEGGELNISFTFDQGIYTNIYLTGPAQLIFKGNYIF